MLHVLYVLSVLVGTSLMMNRGHPTLYYIINFAEVDFFAKVSERRNKRRQQKEPLSVLSPEKIEETCSPPDVITSMNYYYFILTLSFLFLIT